MAMSQTQRTRPQSSDVLNVEEQQKMVILQKKKVKKKKTHRVLVPRKTICESAVKR
jgi:hypothetical protein